MAEADDDARRYADLCARLARCGHSLYRLPADSPHAYCLTRWCWARTFPDLDAVERFARQVGADDA